MIVHALLDVYTCFLGCAYMCIHVYTCSLPGPHALLDVYTTKCEWLSRFISRRKLNGQRLACIMSMTKRRVGDLPFNGPEAKCWISAIQSIPALCKTSITHTETADTRIRFYFEWRISNSTVLSTSSVRRIAICFGRRIATLWFIRPDTKNISY